MNCLGQTRSFFLLNTEYIVKPMSSEGTSLESLESGDIQNEADANRMKAILRDMNVSEGNARHQDMPSAQPSMQDMQPMPSRQPMPPMPPMLSNDSRYNEKYQQEQEQDDEERYVEPKRNIWSQITEQIRDPILVSVLFFMLTLPVFHTFLGKYATWAFAVGGQLSWLGLISLSLIAGILFAVLRGTCGLLGI